MELALDYLEIYMRRMKERLRASNSTELKVKVFEDSVTEPAPLEVEKVVKPKKVKKKRTKKKKASK